MNCKTCGMKTLYNTAEFCCYGCYLVQKPFLRSESAMNNIDIETKEELQHICNITEQYNSMVLTEAEHKIVNAKYKDQLSSEYILFTDAVLLWQQKLQSALDTAPSTTALCVLLAYKRAKQEFNYIYHTATKMYIQKAVIEQIAEKDLQKRLIRKNKKRVKYEVCSV